jgi:hypothetical protein
MRQYHLSVTSGKPKLPSNIDRVHAHLATRFSCVAADLNGAWANDPNVCSQIFVKKNNRTSMADHSELYGRGFIVQGDQITDSFATCHIKERKVDDNTVRLVADCSTRSGRFTDQIVLRIDDNNRVTRFSEGTRLGYFRCPTIE